jgi:hypothetical protein
VSRRSFTVLAVVSAAGSVALFVAGASGGIAGIGRGSHGEGSSGYFVGSLVAMVLAGVFTYLGLTGKRADR